LACPLSSWVERDRLMELDADPDIAAVVAQPMWLIWTFEKPGWAYDVRWPTPRRLARLTADR
jgi:hypothetical protein